MEKVFNNIVNGTRMVWTPELQKLVLEESESSEFYVDAPVRPEDALLIADILLRPQLTARLAGCPVWMDRRDYNPDYVKDEDMPYVEILGYLNGNLVPEKFEWAPKDAISVKTPDLLKLLTIKLDQPFESEDDDEAEERSLQEIITEVASHAKAGAVYSCDVIPNNSDDAGYFRIVATPGQMVHAYQAKEKYCVKQARALDLSELAVIEQPDNKIYHDFVPLRNLQI